MLDRELSRCKQRSAIPGWSEIEVQSSTDAPLCIPEAFPTTTVRFERCSFRTSVDGPGADVAGLGIDFDSCIFESNGAEYSGSKDENWGGGIVIRSGAATLTSPYFEGNLGHDVKAGVLAPGVPFDYFHAAHIVIVNPVFRKPTPPRVRSPKVFCVVLDAVRSGALLGGDFAQFESTILLKRAQGVLIAGQSALHNPVRVGSLDDYGGFIEYVDYSDPDHPTFQVTGKSARTVAGLPVMRRVRRRSQPIMTRVLAPGALLDHAIDLPATGPEPAAEDVAVASFTALPSGVLLSATMASLSPPVVRATFLNANPTPVVLDGELHVDLWRNA